MGRVAPSDLRGVGFPAPSGEGISIDVQPEPTAAHVLASYALLTGLTPLIPIPFVDDYVQERLMRQLVTQIVTARGVTVPPADIAALAAEPAAAGALRRIAGSVVLYPVKKVLRKTFLVLEGKRAVDLAAKTYAVGWLIDTAIRWKAYPAHRSLTATVVRVAAENACKKLNTSPIEHAIRKVYDESKAGISRAVDALWSSASSADTADEKKAEAQAVPTPGTADADARVEQATVTAAQALPVNSMAERLERLLHDNTGDYFQRLEAEFYTQLRAVTG